MNPWIWAIGALVVAAAELFCPGVYLIWIAAGAGVTALASFLFALTLTAQLVIFAVACGVSCIVGHFVYQRLIASNADAPPLNQRDLEMIGAHGVIYEAIKDGRGKITLGDSVWLAEGPDMAEGAPAVVTGARGTVVIVSPRGEAGGRHPA